MGIIICLERKYFLWFNSFTKSRKSYDYPFPKRLIYIKKSVLDR